MITPVFPARAEPLVACVVLNKDRRQDTLECLDSIRAGTYRNARVILLDCQSRDGSVDAVRARHPDATVIELPRNLGYAGNNDVGIEAALAMDARWVFVLNEDTVLAPDCIEQLVRVAESERTVGCVGPLVRHHDEPGVIQSAGGTLDRRWQSRHLGENEEDRGQFRDPHEVEWVSGCAIMLRAEALREVGAFDGRFFVYWEETEWCVRARKAGWRILNVPAAKLWHKGVQRRYAPGPWVTYYVTRNRLLLLATHHAPRQAWATACVQILRTLVSWSVKPRWRHMRAHRDAMWHGVVDFLRGRLGQMPSR